MGTFTLILISFAVTQSFFLFLYIFNLYRRTKQVSNLFLALIFLSLSIRVLKSALWLYSKDLHIVYINIGFVSHLLLGPLLLAYFHSHINSKKPVQFRSYLMHGFFALIVFLFSPFLSLEGFWYQGAYSALLVLQIAYFVYVFWQYFIFREKINEQFDRETKRWFSLLFIILFLYNFNFILNYFLSLIPYSYAPASLGILVYVLSFFGFSYQNKIGKKFSDKYENQNIADEELKSYKAIVLDHLENKKVYLDSEISLAKLSEQTAIPNYVLSNVFSQAFKKNFSSLVNEYRVGEAKKLLRENKEMNVSQIAFSVGFNSQSTFIAAFKKVEKQTASMYRKSFS